MIWNQRNAQGGATFDDYVKLPVKVKARKMDEPFECVTAQGKPAYGKAGDYLVLDIDGHPYPCDPSIFERTHAEDLGEIDGAWPG